MKNFQVMLFNAIILIALGIYGYSLPPNSPTALISAGIGLILGILSIPVKKENAAAAHIGAGLTGLAMIMFFVVGAIRGNIIVLIMAVVTLMAFISYISDFMKRKRERESEKKS